MKLLNASYFRFLSHSVKHKKIADNILYDLSYHDESILRNEAILNELYEKIKEAATGGKVNLEIPSSHPCWAQREVHAIFREKGFQVHYDTNSIHWCWDTKENELK